MAVVLNSDDGNYFAASSLRRSHSSSKFPSSPSSYNSSTPTPKNPFPAPSSQPSTESPVSSAPSSPQTTHAENMSDFSYASTPATNLSIASDYEETPPIDESPEDHFGFPIYAHEKKFYSHPSFRPDHSIEPPPSPRNAEVYCTSPDHDSFEQDVRPSTPEWGEHAEDDTAIASRPSRQVDYLSHEWKEEDIWSSWRYIVNRRNEFPNSARLENASWRTWAKAKNNLKTISPEALNWLKDCDVTWLYGPLQAGSNSLYTFQTEPSSSSLSKNNSLVNLKKKPILKKRSMSEVMLQRSLSSASLLKQATAAVQAQETRGRPAMGRSNTSDYVTFPFSTRRLSQDTRSTLSSSIQSSSGMSSPSIERKHIHFNEQVEQCIAVDVKGDEDEADLDRIGDYSESEDGVVMKRTKPKKRSLTKAKRTKKRAPSESGKIIAKLPSTTLKYRGDTPEPHDSALKHSTKPFRSPLLSPSSSQETLRPSTGHAKYYVDEDPEGELGDDLIPSSSGWRSPSRDGNGGSHDEPAGMRRTPSGMFMPYEEGTSSSGDGIFGRVVDTVNTARDIAHVIWNVGWRK